MTGELGAHRKTIDARQDNVEHDQIRALAVEHRQRLHPAPGLARVEAFKSQRQAQHATQYPRRGEWSFVASSSRRPSANAQISSPTQARIARHLIAPAGPAGYHRLSEMNEGVQSDPRTSAQ